ncbi:hypothetical protein GW17_00041998 [Ensete ventricosum]|nr:hypothetical protein GW17_00041998 [Ensete ventricosum]RZS14067.1 hypothetical protein BHM03_00045723 [Ensete ventricosum]
MNTRYGLLGSTDQPLARSRWPQLKPDIEILPIKKLSLSGRKKKETSIDRKILTSLTFRGMANPLRKRHHENKQVKKNV